MGIIGDFDANPTRVVTPCQRWGLTLDRLTLSKVLRNGVQWLEAKGTTHNTLWPQKRSVTRSSPRNDWKLASVVGIVDRQEATSNDKCSASGPSLCPEGKIAVCGVFGTLGVGRGHVASANFGASMNPKGLKCEDRHFLEADFTGLIPPCKPVARRVKWHCSFGEVRAVDGQTLAKYANPKHCCKS